MRGRVVGGHSHPRGGREKRAGLSMVSAFLLLPDPSHPHPHMGRRGALTNRQSDQVPQLLLESFPPQVTFRTSQHFPLYPLPLPRPTHTTCAQRQRGLPSSPQGTLPPALTFTLGPNHQLQGAVPEPQRAPHSLPSPFSPFTVGSVDPSASSIQKTLLRGRDRV